MSSVKESATRAIFFAVAPACVTTAIIVFIYWPEPSGLFYAWTIHALFQGGVVFGTSSVELRASRAPLTWRRFAVAALAVPVVAIVLSWIVELQAEYTSLLGYFGEPKQPLAAVHSRASYAWNNPYPIVFNLQVHAAAFVAAPLARLRGARVAVALAANVAGAALIAGHIVLGYSRAPGYQIPEILGFLVSSTVLEPLACAAPDRLSRRLWPRIEVETG